MSLGTARAIDFHAHALVPEAEALLDGEPGLTRAREQDARWFGTAATDINRAQLSRLGPLLTDIGRRLEAMEAAGVDVQVVAPMPVTHAWADHDVASRYIETTNRGIRRLVDAEPDRW